MKTGWQRVWSWWLLAALLVGVIVLAAGISALCYGKMWGEFRIPLHVKSLMTQVKTYAGDKGKGAYPPLSPRRGHLLFEMDTVYPEYVSDGWMLVSPASLVGTSIYDSHPPMAYFFEHCSYYYLGYKVWNEETVRAFAEAYEKRIAEGKNFEDDLPVQSPMERLTRLNDNVSRQMIPDAESNSPKWEHLRHPDSEIPVFIEKPRPYGGGLGFYVWGRALPISRPILGGVVAYQDGHAEFIRYPGKWPMTEKTISALARLESLRETKTP